MTPNPSAHAGTDTRPGAAGPVPGPGVPVRPGMNGKIPSGNQAGVYASTLAYLNAVAATGTDDAAKVVPQMKTFKGKDKLFGDLAIREDGRVIHPIHLFEVKKPEESEYPCDYYKLVGTVAAEQAFRPMSEGKCPMVAK